MDCSSITSNINFSIKLKETGQRIQMGHVYSLAAGLRKCPPFLQDIFALSDLPTMFILIFLRGGSGFSPPVAMQEAVAQVLDVLAEAADGCVSGPALSLPPTLLPPPVDSPLHGASCDPQSNPPPRLATAHASSSSSSTISWLLAHGAQRQDSRLIISPPLHCSNGITSTGGNRGGEQQKLLINPIKLLLHGP